MLNTHLQEGLLEHTNTLTHISTRQTPGGFNTCLEDATVVRASVWSEFVQEINITETLKTVGSIEIKWKNFADLFGFMADLE